MSADGDASPSDGDAGDGDNESWTDPAAEPHYTETREACARRNPLRNLYFGDLHAHTALSWDAYGYEVRATPEEAWAFARGEGEIRLAPLDENGVGTRRARLARPLDFAALTDHIEYVGEMELCTTPGGAVYDSERCADLRAGGQNVVTAFGLKLAVSTPERFPDLCGADGAACREAAARVWKRIQNAAEAAYDRSAACAFTAFVAYEYTASTAVVNWHRNVLFRNDAVPELPPSYFEAADPDGLWDRLEEQCLGADGPCEVITLPHNSNWSNGNLYSPYYLDEALEAQRQAAARRTVMEPVVELFQHKGDMECKNGFAGLADDPYCDFEKIREADFVDCGDTPGSGGVNGFGCISRLDFLRNVFAFGLQEERRLGLNPYRVGVIGSTDTHNGAPGLVEDWGFPGHVGATDASPELRLGPGTITHQPRLYNPGGLAAVWAVENSRDAIFEALRRREVYATSGPRLSVRVFAGAGLPQDWCEREDRVERGYRDGVPMGGVLAGDAGAAPLVVVEALADEGDEAHPGADLMLVQLVKGRLDAQGETHLEIVDLAGQAVERSQADEETCSPVGGARRLCAVWRDPDFDPSQPGFYYIRVLQTPTCRWTAHDCADAAQAGQPPEACNDPEIAKTAFERAWTSPIWIEPADRAKIR